MQAAKPERSPCLPAGQDGAKLCYDAHNTCGTPYCSKDNSQLSRWSRIATLQRRDCGMSLYNMLNFTEGSAFGRAVHPWPVCPIPWCGRSGDHEDYRCDPDRAANENHRQKPQTKPRTRPHARRTMIAKRPLERLSVHHVFHRSPLNGVPDSTPKRGSRAHETNFRHNRSRIVKNAPDRLGIDAKAKGGRL